MPPKKDDSRAHSLASTAAWFLAGGAATFPFSASLAWLTTKAGFAEVILTGMLVPCFTWVVQTAASAAFMSTTQKRFYWGDLGRVCFWGSVVLWPAAVLNFAGVDASRLISAVNVMSSVAFMTIDLSRRAAGHGIAARWPISFLVTICVNMALFLAASRPWWMP